jgi:hypothetical protein
MRSGSRESPSIFCVPFRVANNADAQVQQIIWKAGKCYRWEAV